MATNDGFQRARSAEAKAGREQAILDAAAALGRERGIRTVTLTEIADAIGMHKSALLRYFETREQIFLRLTAAAWGEWVDAVIAALGSTPPSPENIARVLADTLAARPLFCDMLAQAPLNLERNVSFESVRAFKIETLGNVARAGAELSRLLGLSSEQAGDVVAAATSLAGALWQMATPGPELAEFYRTEPGMSHVIVDLAPRLARILAPLIAGMRG
jgi:AcrR family transcriptional regulator